MVPTEGAVANAQVAPPRAPTVFNPDPGVWDQPAQMTDPNNLLLFPEESLPPGTLKITGKPLANGNNGSSPMSGNNAGG